MNPKHLTYIYLAILLLGTLLPINGGSDSALNNNYTLSIRWDYLLHALVYLPLPVLFFALIPTRLNEISRSGGRQEFAPIREGLKNHLLVLLIALTIGTGLEILQMFVPYRSFNINDLIANGVGVFLGWMLTMVFRKKVTAMFAKE